MPPRFATRLIRWLAGHTNGRFVVDDLREEYDQLARTRGTSAARRWYWRQTLTSFRPLTVAAMARAARLFRLYLRDSLRTMRRSPALSAVIVATLMLGIGANAAVFSVVDAVLVRPLPFVEPDRLVALWERTQFSQRTSVAPGNFLDYRRLEAFDDLAAYGATTMVVGIDLGEEVYAEQVTTNLWSLLGVHAAVGRVFGPPDGQPGAPPVVLLSDGFWRRRLGGRADVVGRSLDINRVRHEIVGVLPPTFKPLSEFSSSNTIDLFTALPEPLPGAPRSDRSHRVVGRLRTGETVERAQAQLTTLSAALAQDYPEANRQTAAFVALLPRDISRNVRGSLYVVLGAVGIITLIGCVNVANLLLVWSSGRQRDTAVRLALGASRLDILAEAVIRGVVYSVVGGAAGVLFGFWLVDVLVTMAPASVVPRAAPVVLNTRVITAAAVLALSSGLLASVVPALRLLGGQVGAALQESSRGATGGRAVLRWRGVLLTAEVTAAVVLALGAGLLVRSVIHFERIELGFSTERTITMTVRLPAERYDDDSARLRFFDELTARVSAWPGVEAVTFANQFPMRGGWGGGIMAETTSGPVEGEADLQVVAPSYFMTLGLPAIQGRVFGDADTASSPGVAVISQTFADRFFRAESPIGRIIRRDPASPPLTVVGVVGEVRRDGKFTEAAPQVYFSARQTGLYSVPLSALAIRTAGTPRDILPMVRKAVHDLDSTLVVGGVRTLDEVLDASAASLRFHVSLLGLLAGLAVMLSLIGVYSVISHIVSRRSRDLSVRMALGATRGQVVRQVMAGALGWTSAGVVLGGATAAVTSRMLSAVLFDTTPHDTMTFAVVSILMIVVATAASYVPARRAAASDPAAALRA